jgi:hypothetical protein
MWVGVSLVVSAVSVEASAASSAALKAPSWGLVCSTMSVPLWAVFVLDFS